MAYKRIEGTTSRFRAEYAPYDARREFDEGMKAYAAGNYECPYDGTIDAGYKVLAWELGLECAVRLRFWFRCDRNLPVGWLVASVSRMS